MDILQNMSRIVPSAKRSYDSLLQNQNIPEWQKEDRVRQMLDAKAPKNAPSGMAYIVSENMNMAQSAIDQKANAAKIQEEHKSILDSYKAEDMRGGGLAAVGAGIANIGLSGARFAGNIGKAAVNVFNPNMEENTAYNIGRTAIGAGANAVESAAGAITGTNQEDLFNFGKGEEIASQIGQTYKENYGTSMEKTVNHVYEDPVGFLNDMMLVAGAAGSAAKVSGMVASKMGAPVVGQAMEKFGADLAISAMKADPGYNVIKYGSKAAKATAGAAYGVGKSMAKSAIAQGVGVGRSSIDEIITNLPGYQQAEKGAITGEKLGARVSDAITAKADDLTGVGTKYEALRESGQTARIGTKWFDNMLRGKGINVVKDGDNIRFDLTKKAPALTSGDLSTLSQLRNQYFSNATQTVDDVLHIRDVLSGKAKYGSEMTNAAQDLFRGIRGDFDTVAGAGIKGLKDADAIYSPKVTELGQLRNQWMENIKTGNGESHWVLKPNKISTIRSMSNKGRELALQELEKITPGIGKEIKSLMAFEDVTSSMGPKVGTYLKAGLTLSGITSMNPLLIATGIILQPQVFIPILKGFSKVRGVSLSVVDEIINKISTGTPFTNSERILVQKVYDNAVKKLPSADELSKGLRKKFPNLTPDEIARLTPEEKATGIVGGSDSLPPHLQKIADKYKSFDDVTPEGFGPETPTSKVTPKVEKMKGEGLDEAISRAVNTQIENGTVKLVETKDGWKATIGTETFRATKKQDVLNQVYRSMNPEYGVTSPLPPVGGGLEPLMKEARKYKSAEEFVKAQGEPLYHGTNATFEVFDPKKMGSATDDGLYGKGFYFGNTENFARVAPRGARAKNVMEVYPKSRNFFDISNVKSVDEMAKVLDMSPDSFRQETSGIIRPLPVAVPSFTSKVKGLGYDGVVVKRGGDAIETVVFDPKNLQTKSQLTDLWKQANQAK